MVELVVAMTMIVIAVIPLTSVIWSSLKTAGASSHRTDAFSIAARETETIHADPYALVGFYGDESASRWKATTTVTIGPCSTTCVPAFAPLILPVGATTLAGVTYSIARYLYWADAQGLTGESDPTMLSQAYKATTVTVSWTDLAGNHTAEQDSIVYPGGLGLYSGPGGAVSTTSTTAPLLAPGTPTLMVAVSQPASPLDQQQIDVTITAPAGGGAVSAYFVQWSTDPAFGAPSQSPQLPPTSTFYSIQGLAAGTTYFARIFASNTTGQSGYSIAVSATSAALTLTTTTPAQSTTVPASTTTTTVTCSLGAFTITTSTTGKTYLAKAGTMSEDVILNLAVNGACPWVATVASVLHGTATADPGAPYTLGGPPAGGQWSATVASTGQANWSIGLHDMTVVLAGTATSVSRGLLICSWKPPGQRSALATAC